MLQVFALCLAGTLNYCVSSYMNRAKANNENDLLSAWCLEKALMMNCKSTLPGIIDKTLYRLQYIR